MVKIPLSYNFFLLFNKLYFPHNVFALRFRIFIVTLQVLRILFSSRCLSFSFPLPLLFPFFFFLISLLSLFSFLIFLFLFFFPNSHHFLNLVCQFLRAPLPCSRTFCCPVQHAQWEEWNLFCSFQAKIS